MFMYHRSTFDPFDSYGRYGSYGRRISYSGDLAGRDAQLQGFHRELFLATVKGDKHLISSIKKKIRKCSQGSDPIQVGTRMTANPRKAKKRR